MNRNAKLGLGCSALLAACSSLFCGFMGLVTLMGGSTYEVGAESGQVPPGMGLVFLCLALLVWLLPAGVWWIVRAKA
ncbi:MAG: hypothetical protein GXO36_00250 [Chloroflexi bacterium]|nr:hypothetical protein [Chloroflexota bacterium]